jgi:hypothetical protein
MRAALKIHRLRVSHVSRIGVTNMKAISSSIVVLAGSILLAGGAAISHSDTQIFICGVGVVIGLAGMIAWVFNLGVKAD